MGYRHQGLCFAIALGTLAVGCADGVSGPPERRVEARATTTYSYEEPGDPKATATAGVAWSDATALGTGTINAEAMEAAFTYSIVALKGAQTIAGSSTTGSAFSAYSAINKTVNVPDNKRPTVTAAGPCGWKARATLTVFAYNWWIHVDSIVNGVEFKTTRGKTAQHTNVKESDQISCVDLGCDNPETILCEECEGGEGPYSPPNYSFTAQGGHADEVNTEITAQSVLVRCYWEDHYFGPIYLGRVYTTCEIIGYL